MPIEEKWDEYLEGVRRYLATGRLDPEEIDYKVEIGRKLEGTRSALLAGEDGWFDLLKQALSGKGHPMDWRDADYLKTWMKGDREAGREALRTIWSDGNLKPGDIRAFSGSFPSDVGRGGARSRLRTISVLLMALGPDRYPPYVARAYGQSFGRLSYDSPPAGADEEAIYWHALAFLDELVSRAKNRGLERPANRLEAQSIVWVMRGRPELPGRRNGPDLAPLARVLHLPVVFLRNIETLLQEKKQVIFQGPPGTGKTYVAKELARHLAGGDERCRLVQFHPSYSYEDFVQGYRPRLLDNGQPGFALKDGPLMQIARQAEDDPDGQYFLIIDEINRGNLAKVFGELYFLLEYRETPMNLMYQEEDEPPFTMPGNLHIIWDDEHRRSLHRDGGPRAAAAVRVRRFLCGRRAGQGSAAPLAGGERPGQDGMGGGCRGAREYETGRPPRRHRPELLHAHNLDEAAVERIWKHNVLPYVEEHLFGERDRLHEFALDKIRRAGAADHGKE